MNEKMRVPPLPTSWGSGCSIKLLNETSQCFLGIICYGKRVTVFAIAIAAGDIIKYKSFIFGSFVGEFTRHMEKSVTQ